MTSPSWAVVATVREPFSLLAAFVAHYLSIGASEILLFVDQPKQGEIELLNALDGVTAIDANTRYFLWAHGTKRPAANMRRQRMNADHAYRTTNADWLLHVDADEFLRPGALVQELQSLPEEVDVLRIENGERAFAEPAKGLFDGVMRRMPDRPRRVRYLFDEVVGQYSTAGFSGHALGKSMTRTGRDFRIGIHAPLIRHDARVAVSQSAIICHFDGMTPLHWAQKLWRYVGTGIYDAPQGIGRARYLQIAFAQETAGAPARLAWLHNRLKTLLPAELPTQLAFGLVEPIGFRIDTSVARVFGRGRIDLSAAAFDQALLADAGEDADDLRLLAKELAAPSDVGTADLGQVALDLAASA